MTNDSLRSKAGGETGNTQKIVEKAEEGVPARAQGNAPADRLLSEQAAEVGRLYPAVYQRFHVSKQTMPGVDVTPRMFGVLHHLAGAGPLTLGELVLHLSLSKPTTTELVDRLEAKGLASRMRDERDHRRVFIWLTDEGRRIASLPMRVLEDDELARAMGKMTAKDRTKLITGLRALLAAGTEERNE